MARSYVTKRITPTAGSPLRLGRHIEHDPRSRNFPAPRAPLKSVVHRHYGVVFNQEQTNACSGFAAAALLMTKPCYRRSRTLAHADALSIYARATHLDPFRGIYPPADTGSSGLAVMKAARQLGYVDAYAHAFGLQHALEALVVAPVVTGVYWYGSFDKPRHGRITKSGPRRGGHEFVVVGIHVPSKTVRACNSWGPHWGDGGFFELSWSLWGELLEMQGDVTTATARAAGA
jgi:hypothetical protein